MKTYLINLNRRQDRLIDATRELHLAGIDFERFPAIDGRDYSGSSELKPGLIGCNLSHYFLIERAKMLKQDAVIIFEDDVVIHPDYKELMPVIIDALPDDWDMLYLGGSHREAPEHINDYVLRATKTLTTHAYIMRASMFDRALELLKSLDNPVDCCFADLQKEFNVYISNPPMAWQRESFSDIENRVMNYDWIKTNQQ